MRTRVSECVQLRRFSLLWRRKVVQPKSARLDITIATGSEIAETSNWRPPVVAAADQVKGALDPKISVRASKATLVSDANANKTEMKRLMQFRPVFGGLNSAS